MENKANVTIIRPDLTPEEREKRIKRLEQCLAQFAIAIQKVRCEKNVDSECSE